ncbi:ABC transporter substrate-binding protein [Candidatus Poriferisocius sp.]|uniref:ABC transporter substrate-binding protein n=1 Tax=Candidatus Poriferisocius sp. TaxID=3101276 RepID=UPI003B01965F
MKRGKGIWPALLTIFVVFALAATSCGNDDSGNEGDDAAPAPATEQPATEQPATEEPAPEEPAEEDPFAGCGEGAEVDPSILAVGRPVARCEPGYPKAIPLAERQTINFSSSFKLEFIAPILLADSLGEFEKENLDFNFINLGLSDALPQIGTGQIDLGVGGIEAAVFNAIDNDFDVRWVSANFFPPNAGDNSVPQTGVWARADVFSDPSNPDIAELEGTKMASAVGLSSVIAYPIAEALKPAGLVFGVDVEAEQIPSTDMILAMENNAVQSAWILDPLWGALVDRPDEFVFVTGQPPGEPIGGLFGGPSCRETKRDACVAFHRAIIRTINTYLTGDYHQNDEIVEAIAEAIDREPDAVRATPSLLFDWEIREGTATRAQEAFISFAEAGVTVVEYDEPYPEDQVVDRSIYLEAIGRQ